MNGAELIGMVVALYLREQLSTSDREGTARFIIDNLTPEQTAAAVRAILSDSSLSAAIDVKMPARFLAEQGLPNSVLTDKRATYFRNSECQKTALLLANTGDCFCS
jgi:S-DNA-T family DNA segregation ATPase FtsK/SpoIIIE